MNVIPSTSKIKLAARLLVRQPSEFRDRALNSLHARWELIRSRQPRLSPMALGDALIALGETAPEFGEALAARDCGAISQHVRSRLLALREGGPFVADHNADFDLAEACHTICRALRPAVTVETGVAYGVTSSFILDALAQNNSGQLWSVDLPPLARQADDYVGYLVPEALKERWVLTRGCTQRVLPGLMASLGTVDLFVHDSLHTYTHMMMEFELAWQFLRPGGVLIADDVEGNFALQDFTRRVDPAFCAVVAEKTKPCAFAVLIKAR